MTVILGIDPGSNITGYGVIEVLGNRQIYISCGCIRVSQGASLSSRLADIYKGIQMVYEEFKPQEAAIERVFMHQNPSSALKLGQARGVAMVVLGLHQIPVSEYSPREVKQAVVGYGAAEKEQVQHMVKTLLSLSKKPQADAADALAIALCHGVSRSMMSQLQQHLQGKKKGEITS